VQNGHILYTTALHYLQHGAAFFVRWVVQPAVMTLQAWSRRAEVTCDRASLLAVRDLDKTLLALVRRELGLEKGSAFNAEDYLKALPEVGKGLGRFAELFRSHPYVPKRVQALRLFADSALYAQVTGGDPTGKPSLTEIDKRVTDLISVF
jgi:Zn-dependent protease with chaperone function